MPEPVNMQKFGGLKYNANLVKSTKVYNEGLYEILFKTGEKIVYPLQPQSKTVDSKGNGIFKDAKEVINVEPTIIQTVDTGLIFDNTHFNISDVMGAKFFTSNKSIADVNLNNCENTFVNLAGNSSQLYGDKVSINNGKNNFVQLDKKDTAEINGQHVEGKGIASQKDY